MEAVERGGKNGDRGMEGREIEREKGHYSTFTLYYNSINFPYNSKSSSYTIILNYSLFD